MPSCEKLYLPEVTICAATSVNIAATVRALQASLDKVAAADCILLTDSDVDPGDSRIRVAQIAPMRSSAAYSDFILTKLLDHVSTSHCLVVQWDGHVLDARRWQPTFLDFDYIGASWPQFADGHDVGNGGFSLRSRRLMEACRAAPFEQVHPEDTAIGRVYRAWLEQQGMRFAPREVADLFSAERASDPQCTFGYHGVFNTPRALGVAAFWDIYQSLDYLGTIRPDFWPLVRAVSAGRGGWRRAWRMLSDRYIAGRYA